MSETSPKPSSFPPLETRTQNSWGKYKDTVLFKLLKMWAKATVCVVVLPTICFICVPLSFFLIPPLFIASAWAFFICKILYFLCPDRVVDITMKFFRFCTALLLGSTGRTSTTKAGADDDEEKMMKELIAKSLEDREQPMSEVELDPSEVPCFYDSDDHHEQEIREEQNLKEEVAKMEMYELEEGWQVVVPRPPKSRWKKEKHTFHDVLSYWKSKEKGEAASAGKEED